MKSNHSSSALKSILFKDRTFQFLLLLLILGVVYRLIITANGNFLFNMDNARDMVDVREMVILKHLRLTGPNSAITGLYNGPGWYYILAVPFLLTVGNPYAEVLMMIFLWFIGGIFLILLVKRFDIWAQIFATLCWILSNYIVLTTLYAFNPNPLVFLTPVFIFCLEKYILTNSLVYSLLVFLIAGLLFNLEMNFGVFIPVIILSSILLSGRKNLIKKRQFILGVLVFMASLLPQFLFDLKHHFVMTNSVIQFLESSYGSGESFNPLSRLLLNWDKLIGVLNATFFNLNNLTYGFITTVVVVFIYELKKRKKLEPVIIISFLYILLPFLGYVVLPVSVNPWHLGGVIVAMVIIVSYALSMLGKINLFTRLIMIVLLVGAFWGMRVNLNDFFHDLGKHSTDPSVFANELAAVDYVYQYANGKNFRVYNYLPSVYDYPYQYIFWWRGLKKYGYTPKEYAYLPNKPAYISGKELLNTGSNPGDSGLIFLIKEPNNPKLKDLWENSFKHLELISATKVGPLEVEVRR